MGYIAFIHRIWGPTHVKRERDSCDEKIGTRAFVSNLDLRSVNLGPHCCRLHHENVKNARHHGEIYHKDNYQHASRLLRYDPRTKFSNVPRKAIA